MGLFNRFKSALTPTSHTEPHAPRIHDYRDHQQGWGHNCFPVDERRPHTINAAGQRQSEVNGLGRDVREGDYLLLGSDRGSYWRITAIKHSPRPGDLWIATIIREDPPSTIDSLEKR
jgi:hypothetical protein